MIKGIAHVCIGCTDLTAVRRLYCDTLGFTPRFEFKRKGNVFGFYLEVSPGMYLEFFQSDSVPPAGSPIRHFCLETDDLDGVIGKLRAAGYTVTDRKLGADQAWQAWLKDAPDGVAIEFHQYTPNCSQRTGRTCEVDW